MRKFLWTIAALGGGAFCTPLFAEDGDRFTQLDVRFGKNFRLGGSRRISASMDVYNLMNSSAVLTQNNTVGPLWRSPTAILQGRLVKFGAQLDF